MAVMEISVLPIGTETTSISPYVAEAVKVLMNEKGIKYQTTAMCTVVEGDLKKLLDVALKVHEAVMKNGPKRVHTTILIDDRRDKEMTMEGKIRSVEEKLK
jgi:uncharacterized protein (TIGR00106 family)